MKNDMRAESARLCVEYKWVEKTWEHKLVIWILGVDACGYRIGWGANEWLSTFRMYICMYTNKARDQESVQGIQVGGEKFGKLCI